jgi:uncharacterized repeat protein (TIGR01451 family)
MYPDFYYVDMAGTGEAFQAILPKPSPETVQVIYYIEAVDVGFSSNRTIEHLADVVEDEDDCRRRDPAAAYYTGGNPGIVVGALKSGVPAVPAGFLADGITGFIPLSVSGGGGGAGATAALAVGGAAAGAVAVGVLAAGGDQSTTTTTAVVAPPPPAPTTTTAPSVPPPTPSVRACFNTSPASGVIEIGERIKLDARCSEPSGSISYHWDLGDGRQREGVFIEPPYSTPGTYTVVLTVRRVTSYQGIDETEGDEDSVSRLITVKEPDADLTVTKTGSPNPYYPWNGTPLTYSITVQNRGPATATDVTVVDTLPPEMMVIDNGGCLPSTPGRLICRLGDLDTGDIVEVTIEVVVDYQQEPELGDFIENRVAVESDTVDPDTSNNSDVARTNIEWGEPQRTSSLNLELTSLLDFQAPDDPSPGYVVLNGGRTDSTMSGTIFPHRFQAQSGRNTIEAHVASGAGRPGTWRFDFSTTPSFVTGSLRPEMGQIVSQEAHGIVFRLSGQSGERLRFSFELSPRGPRGR